MSEVSEMHVPTAWLIGALWLLTVSLAGFLGRLLYTRLGEIEQSLEKISDTGQKLAEAHARVEERHSALQLRVERIERTCEKQHP